MISFAPLFSKFFLVEGGHMDSPGDIIQDLRQDKALCLHIIRIVVS